MFLLNEKKGIFNLLELCEERKIKNFFLASSSEVYQTPNKIPTDEKEMLKIPDVYNPRYSYGAGKIISELICLYYSKKKILDKLIIFRPHNVYGPDMGREHAIPEFLYKAKLNKILKIRGMGKEVRSFIHINDFLDAFGLIFKKGKNIENVVNKSKTNGEPPLMLSMSVFFAIKNAISSVGDYSINPDINAPATPEKILMSINKLKKKYEK